MIQTPVSATDHQIAILQSLANSGIRQFAAGGKARAFGDSAGQEIGEAEREKVCRDGSCAIRIEQAGASDLGKIFQAKTAAYGLHPGTTPLTWVRFSNHLGKILRGLTAKTCGLQPGTTPLAWVRFSNHLGKISSRGATSRKARMILAGGFQAATPQNAKLARWELEEAAIPPLHCPIFRPLRGNKSALFEKKIWQLAILPAGECSP
ncbi:MAG: hypothetical protein WCE75_05025 [Terracidiphilus sp.]